MNQKEVKSILIEHLLDLISSNYILLDLPYFTNIGDVLIWESALQILKHIPHKCLYSASIETYEKQHLNNDTIILFMGGGNYGDLWERHQVFRRKVMTDCPENKIIQLPQSVYFNDKTKLVADIEFMDSHKGGMTICCRDQQSFDIVSTNYIKVKPILLPDMALSFDAIEYCKKYHINIKEENTSLFVRRKDSEMNENKKIISQIPKDVEEGDWPTMVKTPFVQRLHNKCIYLLEGINASQHFKNIVTNFFYKRIIKDSYIQDGIKFLSPYNIVYSTRLHASILAYLLGKQVYMLDNSYGKCYGVYNLWMRDQTNISLL